jgi:protein-S-isoprenylcysteine O-methyltransferase Ste14
MNPNSLAFRAIKGLATLTGVMAIFLFAAAGTLRFWQGWAYLLTFMLCAAASTADLVRRDPALVARRMRAGPTAETEPAQKLIQSVITALFVGYLVVAGLDRRFGWSAVPLGIVVAGNALTVLGFVLIHRVFRENTFAASTITLSDDQRVIDTGPYAVVRHPMYAAALFLFVGTPLALASYWTLLLSVPLLAALMARILDEERFLSQHLAGYADYRQRVRWRLVPGLW